MLNVFMTDQSLYQKAGFTTQGNRAICSPGSCKKDTTRTAELKGQDRHPIIFYGSPSTGHSQYLSPASSQKIDTGVVSVCILAQMINESVFLFQ